MIATPKRILVAALDWGLGHATRSVQLIRKLHGEGHTVIIASAGNGYEFYQSYFPALKLLRKPAYGIKYYRTLPFSVSILLQIPKILSAIRHEHHWLEEIIRSENIDEVYSDNCYGLWNDSIKTVIITHQLKVICPPGLKFLESILQKRIATYINRFTECWVPDFEGQDNLSGSLSHFEGIPANVRYIDPLSRFSHNDDSSENENYDLAIVLSGPEPQRSVFEAACKKKFTGRAEKVCILGAKPGKSSESVEQNITYIDHADDKRFASILRGAGKIICRSGYSTLMDLHYLGLKATLIPTEGQTEQMYLANISERRGFISLKNLNEVH
jgi:uncharacterized protein (TIGR00661 family)